jgi:cytochrome P450
MIPAYMPLPGDGVPDAIRRDYLGFLADVVRQCGDIGMYERGGAPVVLVNTPALVRAMLIDGSPVLTKGDLQRSAFRKLLGDSLSMSDGERHHRLRRVLAPLFSRHAMTRHAGMIIATAETIVDSWADEIDLFGELYRLTVHTLGRALVDEPGLWDETSDFWSGRERLWRWITGAVGQGRSLVAPVSYEPEPDVASAIITVQATLDDMVHQRGQRADLLGDLSASGMLRAVDVRDQILALLFAGHETSAVTLFWALYLLSRDPAEQGRLEHEVDGIDLLRADLPYTALVIKEAMRLYPPAGRQTRWRISPLARAGESASAVSTHCWRPGCSLRSS